MINTTRLRCMIGWLGALLPWLVALLLFRSPESISAIYYTQQGGPIFMIILGSASLLLFSYKGYDKQDDIINSLAAVFGLMICIFPCYTSQYNLVGTFQLPANLSNIIHCISAVLFFGLLAYNSLFLFTKHGEEMSKKKKIRNIIYIICGIGMLASFSILALPHFRIQTWLTEALALFFFGVSWLTKANHYPWLFSENS